MSGISSNIGVYLIGKQSARGAVATTWYQYRAAENEPSIQPDKQIKRFNMTDSSRDQGDAYTSVVQVAGDIPIYLHPDGVALPFFLALGSNADSGVGPNFTHIETPADDLPWFSVFRVVGNVITEQFLDCKMSMLRVEGEAGVAPHATLSIIGITPTWATTPVAPTVVAASPYIYWEGKNLLKIAGSAFPWSKFTWEINNKLKGYQADDYFLNDIDPGRREITFDFTMHFTGPTNEPKYREFIYGSDAGTSVGTGLVAKAFEWTFQRDANTSLKVAMPQGRYAAIPVNPNPSGDPIEVNVGVEVERPAGSPITTVTVKDQIATVGG